MQRRWQPEGYSTVSAYVMANDASRVIDFVRAALDAEELMRMMRPDGGIMHAAIRIGDSAIMIADAIADAPAFPVWLHVYVPDVDEAYRRALGAGATSVQAPSEAGDGDRRCGVMDAAGNTWWLATSLGG